MAVTGKVKLSQAHKDAISRGLMGRVVSEETRAKIGASWNGRIVKDAWRENMSKAHINPESRRQKKMNWRKEVHDNSGHACEMCGQTNKLVAHHVLSKTQYPELEFEVDNGMTLCISCHISIHEEMNRGE